MSTNYRENRKKAERRNRNKKLGWLAGTAIVVAAVVTLITFVAKQGEASATAQLDRFEINYHLPAGREYTFPADGVVTSTGMAVFLDCPVENAIEFSAALWANDVFLVGYASVDGHRNIHDRFMVPMHEDGSDVESIQAAVLKTLETTACA